MTPSARFAVAIAVAGAITATGVIIMLPRPHRGSSSGTSAEQNPVVVETGGSDLTRPDPTLSDLFVPPFTLTDQNGQSVTQDVFQGGYTAIDFIFTHCPFICPSLTAAMQTVAEKLKDTPVRIISFSVDPQRDTPEQLRDYARRNEIDTSRWTLVTGDRSVIWDILENGLQWHIEERPEQRIPLPDGSTMANIAHPGWIALVGPDGKLAALCTDILNDQEIEQFVARARALSRSK
jgi:cytochrome oxidase Cu insertion factor (SCO1/SenC/PrrC family)